MLDIDASRTHFELTVAIVRGATLSVSFADGSYLATLTDSAGAYHEGRGSTLLIAVASALAAQRKAGIEEARANA
jgi:hypothetical protein